MKEIGLGINAFNRPTEYAGINAWVRLITQLFFTIPGTYPSDPEMGIGIQTFRYNFFDEVKDKLKTAIRNQTRKYLPDIPLGGIEVTNARIQGKDILVVTLSFMVTDSDLQTAYVAVDVASKTIKYEVSF